MLKDELIGMKVEIVALNILKVKLCNKSNDNLIEKRKN